MGIDLPEAARLHFDKCANELVDLIEVRPRLGPPPPAGDSSFTHKQPAGHLTIADFIGDLTGSQSDIFGNEVTRIVRREDGDIGFWKETHGSFEKLLDALAKRRELRPYLSRTFLRDCLFEWAIGRYPAASKWSESFSDHLDQESEKVIQDHTISIPLVNIEVAKSFRVGKVVIGFLRKEVFDKLEAAGELKESLPTLRKRYQGVVTASFSCRCEQQKAIEEAVIETEKALIALRFFSPAAILAEAPCYFGRLGTIEAPMGHYHTFQSGGIGHGILSEENRETILILDPPAIRQMYEYGLNELSELIATEAPTPFDEILLRALELYTRGLVSRNVQDRVVLALTAIETLLLKSENESIQQNIGQRLAFFVAGDLENRKVVMKTIKDAYKLRSAFLHHGSKKEDLAVLQKLQEHVWDCLQKAVFHRQKFDKKTDLAQALDDQLLG